MRKKNVMTDQEIFDKVLEIVHKSVPETQSENITMDTVIDKNGTIDSLSFIYVITKLEVEFEIEIPHKSWTKLNTFRDVVNMIKKELK